jgi:hypothetical protein
MTAGRIKKCRRGIRQLYLHNSDASKECREVAGGGELLNFETRSEFFNITGTEVRYPDEPRQGVSAYHN